MQYKLYNQNKVDGKFQGHEFRRISIDAVSDNVDEFIKAFNEELANVDWRLKIGIEFPDAGTTMYIVEYGDYDDEKNCPYHGLYGVTSLTYRIEQIEGFRKPTQEEKELSDYYHGKGERWEKMLEALKQKKQNKSKKKQEKSKWKIRCRK